MKKLRQFRKKYSGLITIYLLIIGFSAALTESVNLGIIATLSFSLLGIDVLILNTEGIIKMRASRDWPTVAAKITQLQSSKIIRPRSPDHYRLDIQYQYYINDNCYEGKQYYWSQECTSRKPETIEKRVEDIRLNQNTFLVYVNPEDHSESVVNPKLFWYYYLGPAAGLAMIIGFGFFALALAGVVPMPEGISFKRSPIRLSF